MEKYAVSIARQYGSGGREIGKALAAKLGIEFYDKELITLAAKKNGMSEKAFQNVDEKPTNSLLYSLAMGAYAMDGHYVYWGDVAPSLNDRVYQIQTELIRELSADHSSLFVGRCADYVLSDTPRHISIFIAARLEDRAKKVVERDSVPENKAIDIITKTDKKRANYYSFHTNKEWGNAENYDLCVNVSAMGTEKTVDMLYDYIMTRIS